MFLWSLKRKFIEFWAYDVLNNRFGSFADSYGAGVFSFRFIPETEQMAKRNLNSMIWRLMREHIVSC
jgi:hypothetical protein